MNKHGRLFFQLGDLTAGVAAFGILLAITLQIFYRFALKNPIPWADELARYLHIWVVFIGVIVVEAADEHIRIDFFARKIFGRKLMFVQDILSRLVTLGLSAALLVSVIRTIGELKSVKTPSMQMPMPLFFFPTLVCSAALIIISIYRLAQISRKPRYGGRNTDEE